MSESGLQRQIIKHVQQCNGHAVRLRADAGGNANEPDILACHHGVAYAIEVKRPGSKPRRAQLRKLAKWADAGAVAFVAYKVEHVSQALCGIREALPFYGGRNLP